MIVALRALLKNPGFTAISVLSLGLGIGAGTAVFSLLNAIVLRSLPVPDPQQLRLIHWSGTDARFRSISGHFAVNGNRATGESFSPSAFETFRETAKELADISAFAPILDAVVRGQRDAFTANGMIVSDNFFSVLRVHPASGALFEPREPEDAYRVVISDRWWSRHFGRADVIGKSLTVNGTPLTIMGVLPADFEGIHPGKEYGFYVPMARQSPFAERAVSVVDHWWVRLIARTRPATPDAKLRAALNPVLISSAGEQLKNAQPLLLPGAGGLLFDRVAYGKPLFLMLGAVGLVLLVACANFAGLTLARGAARRGELAIRAALGASRARLVRESLSETLLVTIIGGGFALLVATWMRSALGRLLAASSEGLAYDLSFEPIVFAFALGMVLLTALISGLLPGAQAGSADPVTSLKSRSSIGAPRLRLGRVLVIAQVTLTVVLLSSAGLYVRSLSNLKKSDTGFQTEKLLVFQLNAGFAGYKEVDLNSFYDRVQNGLSAIPGVRGACVTVFPLLDNKSSSGGFSFAHRRPAPGEELNTYRLVVSETFFDTIGVSLLRGRSISAGDTIDRPKAIVVNEAFVRKYLPDRDPIGHTVSTWRSDWQIVGVCRDIKYENIKQPAPPTIYISHRQFPLRYGAYFLVATTVPPMSLANSIRTVVNSVDPAVPVGNLTTQEVLIDRTISKERLFATVCSGLALFALLLACIGLYGLISFNVERRKSEIAVRMAIGAPPATVARAVITQSVVLVLAGLAIGMPMAFAVGKLLQAHFYNVQPSDPVTLLGTAITLLLVSALAAGLPARRALRVHPADALKAE